MRNRTKDYKILEDYGKDTLPFLERFNLEKDALDDDFLFEALEGYAYAERIDQQKVLNSFTLIVKQNEEAAVIRKLVPYRWIGGIAASLLLFSAATYFYKNTLVDTPESISIVANADDAQIGDILEDPRSEIKDGANIVEDDIKEREKSLDIPNNSDNKNKNIKQNLTIKPKAELKSQPETKRMSLTRNDETEVQKLSEGVDDLQNKEEFASPSQKAPTLNKKAFLKSNKAIPSVAMELRKEGTEIFLEEEVNEFTSSILTVFVKEELEKLTDKNFTTTNMNMFLDFSEDSRIKEVIFISGCQTCFDAIYKSLLGKEMENMDANHVGKKLIFRFKSK